MTAELKQFLQKYKQDLNKPINEIDWQVLYKRLSEASQWGYEVGEFTRYLLDKNIHPEDYTTYIPPNFLRGSSLFNLTQFDIPSCNKGIGGDAFHNCKKLEKITIPPSIDWMQGFAFSGCESLKEVHISNLEAWCKISFMNTDANPLINGASLYLNNQRVTELVIPSAIPSIRYSTFEGCSSIEKVIFSEGIISIGQAAFRECANLSSIVIPKSLKEINFQAFHKCESLTTIYYEGTIEDFNNISIAHSSHELMNANIHFNY